MPLPLPAVSSPLVVAPMGGGPTTPQLVAGAGEAGAMGYLASGYRSAEDLREQIAEVRTLSAAPFGVNIFAPLTVEPHEQRRVAGYVDRLRPVAHALGVEPGNPVHSDDDFDAKVRTVVESRPDIVSFTFGLPPPRVVQELHRCEIPVAITVTDAEQAEVACDGGADCLIVQGWEAGAHRGGLADPDAEGLALLPLLRLVASGSPVPVVATGGIADGAAVAAVLAAGASAAMLGTAFMRCPEAGTAPAHAAALTRRHPTAITRAFTGRSARGLTNRFLERFSAVAPAAYPEVHNATAPLRAAARRRGDLDNLHLWAGQAHELAEALPVGELVARMTQEAKDALARAATVL